MPENKIIRILGIKLPKLEINGMKPSSVVKVKVKLNEIRDLLPKSTKTFSTKDFKLNSPKENGKSFLKNSLIKAKFFSRKTNLICLADDSGLEIDILNGKPGIFSARWGGRKNNFNKAIISSSSLLGN